MVQNFLILSHEQSSCTLSEKKQNVDIFIQVSKQRKWKNIKNEAAESYLEPCHEVVQDTKINLK